MIALLAAIRAAHFMSLMAAFGAGVFQTLLRRHRLGEAPARTTRVFFPAMATLGLITAVIWLFMAAGQMAGDWHAALDPGTLKIVLGQTKFGRIAVWRIGGLMLFWIVCLGRGRSRDLAAALLTALLLGSLALTSHAAAAEGGLPPLARAGNDAVHLLAAGFWVGGLIVLGALVWSRHAAPSTLIAPFRLFSRWGTVAVALLVLSGITNAAIILPIHAVTPHNAYADLLAIKIALALGMIALAVINRQQLVPALGSHNGRLVRQLAASVAAEIFSGALVIGIVGYLGQMPPG